MSDERDYEEEAAVRAEAEAEGRDELAAEQAGRVAITAGLSVLILDVGGVAAVSVLDRNGVPVSNETRMPWAWFRPAGHVRVNLDVLASWAADDDDDPAYRRGVADTLKRLHDTMDGLAMSGLEPSRRWAMMRQVMRTAVGR